MGIFEGDSGVPTVQHQLHAEMINNTDAYGKSLIDSVYQGSDYSFQATALEWAAKTVSVAFPWNATWGRMGVIGRLFYDLAQALVMTSVVGTPARNAAPAATSITASKTLVHPQYNVNIAFGPLLRRLPVRLAMFPYDSGGNIIWFSTV